DADPEGPLPFPY
nr:zona pellucida-binding protein, AWN-1=C10 fragment [swine, sperm, Peptide Partial, 12 aa] [Sus scrofa]